MKGSGWKGGKEQVGKKGGSRVERREAAGQKGGRQQGGKEGGSRVERRE